MRVKGLKIRVKSIEEDIKKLILTGVVDGHTCTIFDNAIGDVLDGEITKIMLDFSQVTYLSSAGVGVLIAANGKLEEDYPDQPGEIVILSPIESVRDVFQILEIDSSFKFTDTEKEALALLQAL